MLTVSRGDSRRSSKIGRLASIVLGFTVASMQGCDVGNVIGGALQADSADHASKNQIAAEAYQRELDRRNDLEVARILANGNSGNGVSPGALYDLVKSAQTPVRSDPITEKIGSVRESYPTVWVTGGMFDALYPGTLSIHDNGLNFDRGSKLLQNGATNFMIPQEWIKDIYTVSDKGMVERMHVELREEVAIPGMARYDFSFKKINPKDVVDRAKKYLNGPDPVQ